jgi:hypothetical protein
MFGEAIAPLPVLERSVKAEEEQLIAGRLVSFKAFSAEKDFTVVHAAANALAVDIFGCVQKTSKDPKAEPIPDRHDGGLRVMTVGHGSIAWVEAEGEVKTGEKLQTVAGGKVAKLAEAGKNAVCKVVGPNAKNALVEVELF